MLRLAVALAFIAGVSAVAAQPLVSASVGVGSDGPAAFASVGTDLGRLSPQAFVSHTGRTARTVVGPSEEWRSDESRTSAGLVGRLEVTPLSSRLAVAAFTGAAFTAAHQALNTGGPGGYAVSRTGVTGVLGLDATGWVTRSVGVSVSAHQNVALLDLSRTYAPFGLGGTLVAPGLNQWGVGVGVRVGRQR